jgi:2-polyprenyl-3-methyl-5-hydroxy-6-metoxy-1,4-benzoquinol methylase
VPITAGSLPKLGYPDASFAAVTMNHSIEHLHDPVAGLREVRRILQPAGTVWINTPNLDSRGHRIFGARRLLSGFTLIGTKNVWAIAPILCGRQRSVAPS